MKKRIYAMLLAAVMVFGVSACGTSDTEKEEAVASSAILNLGTGDTEGSYYAFGNLLAAHMSDAAGVTVDVVSTEGSVANINGVWRRPMYCPMRGTGLFLLPEAAK